MRLCASRAGFTPGSSSGWQILFSFSGFLTSLKQKTNKITPDFTHQLFLKAYAISPFDGHSPVDVKGIPPPVVYPSRMSHRLDSRMSNAVQLDPPHPGKPCPNHNSFSRPIRASIGPTKYIGGHPILRYSSPCISQYTWVWATTPSQITALPATSEPAHAARRKQ